MSMESIRAHSGVAAVQIAIVGDATSAKSSSVPARTIKTRGRLGARAISCVPQDWQKPCSIVAPLSA